MLALLWSPTNGGQLWAGIEHCTKRVRIQIFLLKWHLCLTPLDRRCIWNVRSAFSLFFGQRSAPAWQSLLFQVRWIPFWLDFKEKWFNEHRTLIRQAHRELRNPQVALLAVLFPLNHVYVFLELSDSESILPSSLLLFWDAMEIWPGSLL